MKLFILGIITSFTVALNAEVNTILSDNYPDFKLVAERYFSQKNFGYFVARYKFSFEKKPDGWFVKYISKSNRLTFKTDTIWLKKNAKWQIEVGNENITYPTIQNFISQNQFNYFHFPYYGYETYLEDAINLLETFPELNDRQTYSLITAYQLMASFVATGSYPTFLDPTVKHNNNESIDTYYFKALSAYYDLQKINPNFHNEHQTLQDLRSNSILDFAMIYVSQGRYNKSDSLLQSVNYSTTALQFANNIITCASAGSILVVDDLMNYFPIYYTQKRDRKKNIIVVCKPLLESNWYRTFLYKNYPEIFTIPLASINDEIVDVVSLQRGLFSSFDELIKAVSNPPDSLKIWADKGTQILNYRTNKFHHALQPSGNILQLETKLALSSGELSLIDLIYTNAQKKSIHFTSGLSMKSIHIPNQNIRKEGLLFTLQFIQKYGSNSVMEIDADLTEELLSNIILPTSSNYFNNLPKSKWLYNYQTFFTAMTKHYINLNATDDAKKWMNNYLQSEFFKNSPANINDFYMMHLMYELGIEDKAFIDLKIKSLYALFNNANGLQKTQYETEILKYKQLFDFTKEAYVAQQIQAYFPTI